MRPLPARGPLLLKSAGRLQHQRSWTFSTAAHRPPLPLYYNDHYEVDLPDKHSFPMRKYRFVREALQRELGPAGLATFTPSPLVDRADLRTVHTEEYVRRFLTNGLSKDENRRIGFPWSPQSVDRALSSTGGTVAATHAVCRPGATARVSGHLAGGTHHAFADRGEGFCVFNDIAVAAMVALRDYSRDVRRVLIVDLDVHQGNGCAAIFASEPRVTTFSAHCEGNFFSSREISDSDLELPVGTSDDAYIDALRDALPALFYQTAPQLTFFQAGVDPHRSDRFGKLSLTSAGLKRRNRLVFDLASAHGSRLVVTMGGGYPKDLDVSSDPFRDVVQAHMDVYRAAASSHHAQLARRAQSR